MYIFVSSVADPDPNLNPNSDLLVSGMDPRIRIRTKISLVTQHWL
jgi:hypothetical protein